MRRILFPAKSGRSRASFSALPSAWAALGQHFWASWPMSPASLSSTGSARFFRRLDCSPRFFRTWSRLADPARLAPDAAIDMNRFRRIQLAVAIACLSGALAYAYIERTMRGNEGADFNQFRAAATLAGTGRLYDYDSIRAAERPFHQRLIPFGRLPFYAVVFKPIALLPYGWGRVAWWIITVLSMAGFAWLWPLKPRFFVVALFWSCSLWMLLNYGQDTALFMFMALAGLQLLVMKRDFAAGLVLSLCASKFHLALAIPLFLAANRRWRALAGGAIGGLVILGVSFLAEGPDWVAHLIELSRR